MTRVVCADCQEEGRDGCFQCSKTRTSSPVIDPHRFTIEDLARDVRVLKGNGVSFQAALALGFDGVADRSNLAAALEELGEPTAERVYVEALR
jgi:hypothetical protein